MDSRHEYIIDAGHISLPRPQFKHSYLNIACYIFVLVSTNFLTCYKTIMTFPKKCPKRPLFGKLIYEHAHIEFINNLIYTLTDLDYIREKNLFKMGENQPSTTGHNFQPTYHVTRSNHGNWAQTPRIFLEIIDSH